MTRPAPIWRLRDRTLELDRAIAAGIVNVTDDSMFEGARSGTPAQAIADGIRLVSEGFEMIDVGAVAARSGPPVPVAEESAALAETIAGIVGRAETDVPVSADTFSAAVAEAAIEAGAAAINDISGAADPTLFDLCAATGVGLVLMHIAGAPREDRDPPAYDDVIERLKSWFEERLEAAVGRGMVEEQIVLDPGLDFDLDVGDDLEILRRLGELRDLGRPLYVSLSRKDFLGAVLAGSWEARVSPDRREWATAGATALAVENGASILRLHDRSALDSMRTAAAIHG